MPPVPTTSGAPRKRRLWTSAQADNCQNTFSFRSDGCDGVNMYDAYVGAVRDLEGPDDPMFDGYGTKVTYIVEIDGVEYREQKYAHEKTRTVTRGKAIKQVSQVVWAAIKQRHAQERECFPDLLKPWYLLRLDRVKKSAFECVLQCRREGETPPSSHAPTVDEQPAFPVPSFTPSYPPPLHSDTIYAPPPSLTDTVASEMRHSFDPAADGYCDTPMIPRTEPHDDVRGLSNNSLLHPTHPRPQADVASNYGSAPGSNTLPLTISSTSHINHSAPSGHAQDDLDAPLNAGELEILRRLLERYSRFPTAGSLDTLQRMARPSTCPSQPTCSRTPSHNNHPVAYGSSKLYSHHGSDIQTSRAEEVQRGVAFDGAIVHEAGVEPMPVDDTPGDDEALSASDDSDFAEDNVVWPKPGISLSPHKWELDESGQYECMSVRELEEAPSLYTHLYVSYDNFATRLFMFLREHIPREQISLPAAKDLELRKYFALDLLYKPLENHKGRRNIRRRLRWCEYAIAARGANTLAYYKGCNLFRIVLPSGRTEDVAYVRWLKPSTCTAPTKSSGGWKLDDEDAFVFIPVKSIVGPTRPGEGNSQYCRTCSNTHYYVKR